MEGGFVWSPQSGARCSTQRFKWGVSMNRRSVLTVRRHGTWSSLFGMVCSLAEQMTGL